MSTILTLLNNENVVALLGGVLGIVFLFIKNKEAGTTKNMWSREVALKALSAGVLEAFDSYTKSIKTPGAALTQEQVAEAHKIAIDVATTVAGAQGVDIRKTIGNATAITFNIKQILEDLKTKGVIKTPQK